MTAVLRASAFFVVLSATLVACGSSPDHTGSAKAVFKDADFGGEYVVEGHVEDPAAPGSVTYDLRFDDIPDLEAIRPPSGFTNTCGASCDARYFDGPEPHSDSGRCEMFVTKLAHARRLVVLVSCGPAYGDP